MCLRRCPNFFLINGSTRLRRRPKIPRLIRNSPSNVAFRFLSTQSIDRSSDGYLAGMHSGRSSGVRAGGPLGDIESSPRGRFRHAQRRNLSAARRPGSGLLFCQLAFHHIITTVIRGAELSRSDGTSAPGVVNYICEMMIEEN